MSKKVKGTKVQAKKKAKSKKKFSTPDFVAIAIFAMIFLVILGTIVYYYGLYRPKATEMILDRAEEFTQLYLEYDYQDKDYSLEPIYQYLNDSRAAMFHSEADRILKNRRGTEMKVKIHEVHSEIDSISWDKAEALVTYRSTESSIDVEPHTTETTIRYSFAKIDGEWLIYRFMEDEVY